MTDIVGFNPGDCFKALLGPEELKAMKDKMVQAIQEIKDMDAFIELLKTPLYDGTVYCIFNITQGNIFDVKAKWVLDSVMRQCTGFSLDSMSHALARSFIQRNNSSTR